MDLHPDDEQLADYENLVYGTKDIIKQLNDTLPKALHRYMSNSGIGTNKLSLLTGIPSCMISRYCNGRISLSADYIYAICIALRLKPYQQRHLLLLAENTMPDERGGRKERAFIIRDYLDSCSYDDSFTVASCNRQLRAKHFDPLTPLFDESEVVE